MQLHLGNIYAFRFLITLAILGLTYSQGLGCEQILGIFTGLEMYLLDYVGKYSRENIALQ